MSQHPTLPLPAARLMWRLRGAWHALVQPLPESVPPAARVSRAHSPGMVTVAQDPDASDTAPCAEPPTETPVGACGWFDSSHELREGLQVREVATPQWPLAWWLQWQLSAAGSAGAADAVGTDPAARQAVGSMAGGIASGGIGGGASDISSGNEGSPPRLLH